jgi:hypothetical protein
MAASSSLPRAHKLPLGLGLRLPCKVDTGAAEGLALFAFSHSRSTWVTNLLPTDTTLYPSGMELLDMPMVWWIHKKTLPYIAFSFFSFYYFLFLFLFYFILGLPGQKAINAFRVDLQLHQSLRKVHLVEPH